MKKISCFLIFSLTALYSICCPVCEKNQPEILKGITHGVGPEGKWDYLIIWATVAIVLVTLFYSIKWLIKPGEEKSTHIKRLIIHND